ncbi:DUF4173 domain-containing protein, partial [Patulibacter medicamentivorans]|uniref:DUF4153 domain-containing protein n=1 Tax=Patulibacter medicamentivorans TaxID=1097667 RepID=UPI0011105B12
ELLRIDRDPADALWRLALGLATVGCAGALARAGLGAAASGRPSASGRSDDAGPPHAARALGRTELLIAIGALVLLFAAYVAVQLRVLFGGAGYVRQTTGLGYGDYARQGFVQLLVVAALTLAVVAVAARRRDRAVRGLLGVLCALTLVVLLSAHLRLELVQDAYGLTRVRYGGHAIVLWLAAVLCVVLAAGAHPAVARRAPRVVLLVTLVGVLGFSLGNPDGRIADAAVARFAADGRIDVDYLDDLSADALPALRRLPAGRQRVDLVRALRRDLERGDGIAGLNLARLRAR